MEGDERMSGYDYLEEGEYYARPSHYPPGYREGEELFVDDQNCFNCEYHNSECCPMYIDGELNAAEKSRRLKNRKEDAIVRNGEPTWCIHWKGRRRRRG